MDSGDAGLSIPMAVSPGRNAPDVRVSYSSSAGETNLGVGFSLSAASVINRCPKTMALDHEQRAVFYDAGDLFCIDGQRMVEISRNAQSVEFRTYPDTQVKILGHVLENGPAYFEAWLPSGDRIDFGKTPETRPMANTGMPRAWLAGERRDARGNAIQYDWCFAEDESGYTAEYALTSIRYSAIQGAEPEHAVIFDYRIRDDVQTTYSRGMALQHSLELQEIQSFGPNERLAYRYEFDYEQSEATGRTLLQSVQHCGGDGTCFAPTKFHYAKNGTGFDDITTNIEAPLSDKASPMLFDVDHDGLPEYVVGDSTPASTLSNPITEWRIAKNSGNGGATPIKNFFTGMVVSAGSVT